MRDGPKCTHTGTARSRTLATALASAGPRSGRPPSKLRHALSDNGVRRYVEGISSSRDAVFVVTDADLAIVGAAHLARAEEHAQIGMSVLPRNRGRGIGAALLEPCVARARNWGVRVMFMNCLVENVLSMSQIRS